MEYRYALKRILTIGLSVIGIYVLSFTFYLSPSTNVTRHHGDGNNTHNHNFKLETNDSFTNENTRQKVAEEVEDDDDDNHDDDDDVDNEDNKETRNDEHDVNDDINHDVNNDVNGGEHNNNNNLTIHDGNDLKNHDDVNEDEKENITDKVYMERAPINSNSTVKALTCPNQCPERACTNGMPRIPGVQISSTTLRKSYTYVSQNWGNVLSPYWAARAVAELGGYEYNGNSFGRGTWMEYLPTKAPPRLPRKDRFHVLCSKCTHYEFFHRGECSAGFGAIAPAILTDTRAAITQHAQRAHPKEVNQIFNFFQQQDWLIYHRCQIMDHKAHAPAVLRTYDVIPDQGTFTVYVMKGRPEDPLQLCDILVQESSQYIQKRNPNITVTILPQSTPYVDFSRLVFAPNVLVACVGSSWSLWSAILANNNTVVSLLPAWNTNVRDLFNTVTFLDHLPTLQTTTFSQQAADQYGLLYASTPNTPQAKEAVLDFFRNA